MRVADGVDELVDGYLAVLLEMHENRVGEGGRPDQWNRLVDGMQGIQLRLRETEPGRTAISRLCGHDNVTVRAWSATNALAWDPLGSRRVLESLAEGPGLVGLEAAVTLREFDAGRLRTDWEPRS